MPYQSQCQTKCLNTQHVVESAQSVEIILEQFGMTFYTVRGTGKAFKRMVTDWL